MKITSEINENIFSIIVEFLNVAYRIIGVEPEFLQLIKSDTYI